MPRRIDSHRHRLAHRSLHGLHQPLHADLGRQARSDNLVFGSRRFPVITAGFSYLPVPLGGAITTLFVIERLWTGDLSQSPTKRRSATRRPSKPAVSRGRA